MSVPYDKFTEAFLSKVTEFEFVSVPFQRLRAYVNTICRVPQMTLFGSSTLIFQQRILTKSLRLYPKACWCSG